VVKPSPPAVIVPTVTVNGCTPTVPPNTAVSAAFVVLFQAKCGIESAGSVKFKATLSHAPLPEVTVPFVRVSTSHAKEAAEACREAPSKAAQIAADEAKRASEMLSGRGMTIRHDFIGLFCSGVWDGGSPRGEQSQD